MPLVDDLQVDLEIYQSFCSLGTASGFEWQLRQKDYDIYHHSCSYGIYCMVVRAFRDQERPDELSTVSRQCIVGRCLSQRRLTIVLGQNQVGKRIYSQWIQPNRQPIVIKGIPSPTSNQTIELLVCLNP